MSNKKKDLRSYGHLPNVPIHEIRGQRVILDTDLAQIYEVPTHVFNQAVKRNLARFPEDFAFQLDDSEWKFLRSQFVILKPNVIDNQRDESLISQFVISKGRGGRRSLPWAFTEHGALMAANILRSERAVRMSVYVVRAFVQMRERLAANAEILKRLAEIDKTLLEHDQSLQMIWSQLQPLLAPPPEPTRKRIGFCKDRSQPYKVGKRKRTRHENA